MIQARDADAMVVIAILVSRVEALVLAGMLEAAGIFVHVGGDCHASVEVNSIALCGHRLRVPFGQYEEASGIIRESGVADNWEPSLGLRKAIIRFLAFWLGFNAILQALWIAAAGLSFWTMATVPLQALAIRVNPQGRGSYFLARMNPSS